MKQPHKPALLTVLGVSLTLLAGLLFTVTHLTPRAVHAQEDAQSGITAPAPGTIVSGTVSIVGTATDPAFQRYELYAKPSDASEDAYVFVEGDEEAVIDGPLGVWETGELAPGLYDLRLRVVRLDGNYDEYFATGLRVGQVAPTPTAIAPTPEATTVVTTIATLAPTDIVTTPQGLEATPTATVTDTVTETDRVTETPEATATAPVSPTATPTEEPTAEPPETPAAPQVTAGNNINVRAGPGTDFDIVGSLAADESAVVTGQNEAGDWWQIDLDGDSGWVLGALVTAENAQDVPVVETPPATAPAPSPTLTTTVETTPTTVTEAQAVPATPASSSVVVAPIASGGVVSVTLAGNDADAVALRAFLLPVLAGFGPPDSAVTATIGLLPDSLPISLTVPPTATVIGGVVRSGTFEGTQIFLSPADGADGAADALVETLRQQLQDAGFTAPDRAEMGGPSSVFLSTDPLFASLTFCSPDDEFSASLSTVTIAGETEVVSISTTPATRASGLCGQNIAAGGSDMFSMLPSLSPPAGAQVRSSGGGSGGGIDSISVSAEAEIETELSIADLAAHYEQQLQDAAWERLDDTETYAMSWSAWSFEDEAGDAWNATFYIALQSGEENNYIATLRAETQQ